MRLLVLVALAVSGCSARLADDHRHDRLQHGQLGHGGLVGPKADVRSRLRRRSGSHAQVGERRPRHDGVQARARPPRADPAIASRHNRAAAADPDDSDHHRDKARRAATHHNDPDRDATCAPGNSPRGDRRHHHAHERQRRDSARHRRCVYLRDHGQNWNRSRQRQSSRSVGAPGSSAASTAPVGCSAAQRRPR